MSKLPTQMQAVVANSERGAELTHLPVPVASAGQLLVKVHYVALNPVDWKLLEYRTAPGSVLCKDYAGVVVALGEGVEGWAVGDRVTGLAMGGLGGPAGGAAEYAAVDADLAWHVPDTLSLAEATTFGIGGTTAALALYHVLGTAFPPAKVQGAPAPWLLVSGGSTSVGVFLIQLAKLAGYRVVATASPRNFPLARSYGADEVVAYNDETAAVDAIRGLSPPPAVAAELAGGSSWEISRGAVSGVQGARYVAVLDDPKGEAELVNLGRAFRPNTTFDPVVRAWVGEYYTRLPSLIAQHGIRPGPVDIREGLAELPAGLAELKAGVSGKKLVYHVLTE